MEETVLPLFPLEVVLLPEEPLPLHIFEERYKTMIGECLEAQARGVGQQDFGVLLLRGQALSNIGCTAHIVNVARKYADGRMDILTVGKRRFELLLTNDDRPYLEGSVLFFDDDGPDVAADSVAQLAIERFRDLIRKLRRASNMPIHLPRPYRYLSFRIAAALPLELEFKQQLLTVRSEAERVDLILRAMDALTSQLDLLERSQAKTRGNGNHRH